MVQDAGMIKEKILSFIKISGPSLPVHIAKHVNLSILFASAFLSELISDRELKLSNMRVGSSPLYLIPGQEPMLENFSQYLKNKEKEAFVTLKENKFLKDKDLHPAIRVALREIKDFAIAFEKNGEVFWRYFIIPESEFGSVQPGAAREEVVPELEIAGEPQKVAEILIEETEVSVAPSEKTGEEVVQDNKEKHKKTPQKKPKKSLKEKERKNNFFNKVKDILVQKGIEILDITEISINKIVFRVKKDEEYLIIAYNKKKISEQDVINSHKKAQELNLPYEIMSFNEPPKRFGNLIEAVKSLRNIRRIE